MEKHLSLKRTMFRLGAYLGAPSIFYCLRPRDVILMYHSIERSFSGYQYAVTADTLVKELTILQKYFQIVPLRSMLKDDVKTKRRAAITFDDAFEDFFEVAFPILKKKGIHSTVFVPTAFIETGLRMKKGKQHCTWDQMWEIKKSGLVDFQSHGHSHKHIKSMDLETMRHDLIRSKEIIESNLNCTVDMFAYPGGKFQDWQHEAIFDLGFKAVFTSISGTINENRKVFPRIAITNKCDKTLFNILISGMGEKLS